MLNKGTPGTIFILSLVLCGPWLGIEPGPSALEASTIPLGYRGGGEISALNLITNLFKTIRLNSLLMKYFNIAYFIALFCFCEYKLHRTEAQHNTTVKYQLWNGHCTNLHTFCMYTKICLCFTETIHLPFYIVTLDFNPHCTHVLVWCMIFAYMIKHYR